MVTGRGQSPWIVTRLPWEKGEGEGQKLKEKKLRRKMKKMRRRRSKEKGEDDTLVIYSLCSHLECYFVLLISTLITENVRNSSENICTRPSIFYKKGH